MVDQVPIRPDVRAYLEMLQLQPRPVFTAEFLASIRTLPPEIMAAADLPLGDIAIDHMLEMPGPAAPITLRLFDTRARRVVGPAVVYFHGGGFCAGSIGSHASLAAEIARQLDLPVISVEYRLAPEHPWPAAPDDAEAAVRWLADNLSGLGLQCDSLILCGDSAGGNLALIAALALRDRPAALPLSQVLLLYPAVDTTGDYPSRDAFSNGYGLDRDVMDLFEQHYRGDPGNWRHSPLIADMSGLPPTVVATASLDPLRDQGRALAGKLATAGCDVSFIELAGTIHGFASFRKAIPSAGDDLARILNLSRALLPPQK